MSYLSIRELNSSLKFLLNPLLSSRLIYLSNDSSNFLLVFLFPYYINFSNRLIESLTESVTELHIDSSTEVVTIVFTDCLIEALAELHIDSHKDINIGFLINIVFLPELSIGLPSSINKHRLVRRPRH